MCYNQNTMAHPTHFDLPSLENYLDDFLNFERLPDKNMLKLETMNALCEHFGHPESACPCFHVAGSKGKGTIASGIAAILREKGYKTGVFSSPHVYHFTERISTGAGAFKKSVYKNAEKELKAGVATFKSKSSLTWFELTTIFAMLVFREAKVDYAVYEVGMGGRLDATNVVHPLAIGMGPIELEHTKILGDTLSKIATEKSGVFKLGVPVVSAPQAPEVQAVFENAAAKNHTKVEYINESDYQLLDAKISASCVQKALKNLDEKSAVSIALKNHLPGRYEKITGFKNIPYLLMDGAHTENSIKNVLIRMQKDGVYGNLIFACAKDKNVEKMAAAIIDSGLFETIYLTRPGDFKKSDFTSIKTAFSKRSNQIFADSNYQKVIKKALEDSARKNLPLITLGSMYLPSEVRKISQNLKNVL